MKIEYNVELKNYSHMACGGKAEKMFFPENEKELLELVKEEKDIFLIGKGSNILFSDGLIKKNFLNLKYMKRIKNIGRGIVRAQAGLRFINLINYMKLSNYSGLEKIAGIPGTVGGLVYMNGGAYGIEIFDRIKSIRVIDENFEIKEFKKDEIKFEYRNTEIKERSWIILEVEFEFSEGFKVDEVYKILLSRKEKQPLNYPNLGSIFKNPKGTYAGKLIEELDLKGLTVGGAKISEKHANFIINYDNCNTNDVIELIKKIKKRVKDAYSIELEEEIIIVK